MKKDRFQHTAACLELIELVDFYNAHNKRASLLATELIRFYNKHGVGILTSFSKLPDVKLVFPSQTMETINPRMVAKKASLYSGASLCVLPCVLHTESRKLDNIGLFVDFITLCRPVIRIGKLVPFPIIDTMPGFTKSRFYYASPEERRIEHRLSDSNIENYAISSDSIPIFGKEEELVRQINEDEPDFTFSPAGTRRIFLPTLEGLDLETLLNVMEDNGDPTLKFRYALKEMIARENSSLDEKSLFSAMERIDLAIRDIDVEMKLIKNDRALRNFEVAVGSIAVGMSLLAPAWMSDIASGVLGSMTVVDGARNLLEISGKEKRMKTNDFYLPWLLSKK